MNRTDLQELVDRQMERDRHRTSEMPGLLERKLERMSASPFAFLRGTAPLFYAFLRSDPSLQEGPPGEGWIVGDLHLENFGAFRPEPLEASAKHEDRVEFNLNDFDDAIVGPWRFDVLRLLTSLVLAARELRATGAEVLRLCDTLLQGYSEGGVSARPAVVPDVVAKLSAKVATRARKKLLDARTEAVAGVRRFVRGPRYWELSPDVREAAAAAFTDFARRTVGHDPVKLQQLEPLDLAFRVAGIGSLGAMRIAILVRGKGGPDGAWMFDMKEQSVPSGVPLLPAPSFDPAERVAKAFERCLERPPRMMGTTRMKHRAMLVRRLAPQEDKLDLRKMEHDALAPLARYLGALTASAHRRGADKPPAAAWTPEQRRGLVDRAIWLAGLHEAAYLMTCRVSA